MRSLDTGVGQRHFPTLKNVIRFGGPALALLVILWFPFDWLSTVWPAFATPFRQVFRTAHDHFIGHTVFFFAVGFLTLAAIPTLRRKPHWYFLGLLLAALMQETIQAVFRQQVPTFTDTNAFKGDALGGASAFLLWAILQLVRRFAHRPSTPA